MISAKVIAASKNRYGQKIHTFIVTMPRYILAEFNTHRMLSKNSASSRAIPFEKMLKSVQENPFIPMAWQKDHKGMQGTEYFNGDGKSEILTNDWLKARDNAVDQALLMSEAGCTKQLVNRLLEPFMWHTVIVTGTDWENFFALRCPKYARPYNIYEIDGVTLKEHGETLCRSKKEWISGCTAEYTQNNAPTTDLGWLKINRGQADIHMMVLAEAIYDAYNESEPQLLKDGQWHIPFRYQIEVGKIMDLFDSKGWSLMTNVDYENAMVKISTAMCARVSYTVVGEEGKEPNYENDINLHDRLATSGHWSPFEHCAQAIILSDSPFTYFGNFRGFSQYRKLFINENITKND